MAAIKWHYYVHRGELSPSALDEIGADGWELVSVLANDMGPTYYFKRPHHTLAEQITLEQRARVIAAPAQESGRGR